MSGADGLGPIVVGVGPDPSKRPALAWAADEAGRTARYPGVELRHAVVLGHPLRVLSEASEHALGLIVGTRGHGGFTGMLLGSVSQGVSHHAHCPVIAVPV